MSICGRITHTKNSLVLLFAESEIDSRALARNQTQIASSGREICAPRNCHELERTEARLAAATIGLDGGASSPECNSKANFVVVKLDENKLACRRSARVSISSQVGALDRRNRSIEFLASDTNSPVRRIVPLSWLAIFLIVLGAHNCAR